MKSSRSLACPSVPRCCSLSAKSHATNLLGVRPALHPSDFLRGYERWKTTPATLPLQHTTRILLRQQEASHRVQVPLPYKFPHLRFTDLLLLSAILCQLLSASKLLSLSSIFFRDPLCQPSFYSSIAHSILPFWTMVRSLLYASAVVKLNLRGTDFVPQRTLCVKIFMLLEKLSHCGCIEARDARGRDTGP